MESRTSINIIQMKKKNSILIKLTFLHYKSQGEPYRKDVFTYKLDVYTKHTTLQRDQNFSFDNRKYFIWKVFLSFYLNCIFCSTVRPTRAEELSELESFYRNISGSRLTPGHCRQPGEEIAKYCLSCKTSFSGENVMIGPDY